MGPVISDKNNERKESIDEALNFFKSSAIANLRQAREKILSERLASALAHEMASKLPLAELNRSLCDVSAAEPGTLNVSIPCTGFPRFVDAILCGYQEFKTQQSPKNTTPTTIISFCVKGDSDEDGARLAEEKLQELEKLFLNGNNKIGEYNRILPDLLCDEIEKIRSAWADENVQRKNQAERNKALSERLRGK